MCGIAGIVRLDGSSVDPSELDRLTDALAHRGPDGRGVFIHGNVGLGHRRLKIIDLSEAAAQPMQGNDGRLILTFNGEIYNFEEERRGLETKGYTFRSRSDTEVLLKLYEEYGTECLAHLRGMFAFAIFDRKRNELFLARDRLGKKPLKYFQQDGVVAFASELKALRTLPQCPRKIDHEALHHFLTMMYVSSPRTGFVGIHKLPAAHALQINCSTGEQKMWRYWSLTYQTDRVRSIENWKEEVSACFEESVRLRMVADVPVGAFLSGGLDSAAVTACMSRMSSRPVKTFSIGSSDLAFNELPEAALTARAFRTDHHPIVLDAKIVELLPKLVWTYEEPYADPSAIPTYLISEATRTEVTVALNGDGGDENFAGYVRYPILLFSERWRRAPALLHALVRGGTALFHALTKNTLSYRMLRFEHSIHLRWQERYLQYLSFFTEEEKRTLYAQGFGAAFPRTDQWYAAQTVPARARAQDLLHQAMSVDSDTYLADDLLPKVDLGSMAHALETRSPFLDHRLLELTAQMPPELKIRGRTTKWFLKQHLLKDILPSEVLRKRKSGFRLPLNRWFRGPLKGFVRERLLSRDSGFFWDMFDRTQVESFLNEYDASRVDFSDHVWALLYLREWTDQFTI